MSRRCPRCKKLSRVIDTREHKPNANTPEPYVRRTRSCKCGLRWSTIELIAGPPGTKRQRKLNAPAPLVTGTKMEELKHLSDLLHELADRVASGDLRRLREAKRRSSSTRTPNNG